MNLFLPTIKFPGGWSKEKVTILDVEDTPQVLHCLPICL